MSIIFFVFACLFLFIAISYEVVELPSRKVRQPCTCGERKTCTSIITHYPQRGFRRDTKGLAKCGKFRKQQEACQSLKEHQEKELGKDL